VQKRRLQVLSVKREQVHLSCDFLRHNPPPTPPFTILLQERGYASDDLDGSAEEEPTNKRRKTTKAADGKSKGKAKGKAKKKAKKDSDDEENGEDDTYTALSRSMWANAQPKPPVGSFENCVKCGQQFTVVSTLLRMQTVIRTILFHIRPNTLWLLILALDFSVMRVQSHQAWTPSRNRLLLGNAKFPLINARL
jgi:hypothetical protein